MYVSEWLLWQGCLKSDAWIGQHGGEDSTTNMGSIGSMVTSMRKRSISRDSISSHGKAAVMVVFRELILGKGKIFRIFSKACLVAEQERDLAEVRKEAPRESSKDRMFLQS